MMFMKVKEMKLLLRVSVILLFLSSFSYAQQLVQGIIKPIHDVELSVMMDGVVKKVFVKEGDHINKNVKILIIANDLQKLETKRREIIYKDYSTLESKKENLKLLKEIYESSKELYRTTKSVSLDDVKNLQMQYRQLQGDVGSLEQQKKKEKVEYEIAAQVLEKYTLKSPINGLITNINIESGEWAKAGESIVRIVDSSICYFETNIEEKDVQNLKLGSKRDVIVDMGNRRVTKSATLRFISSIADASSALVRVKFEFDNSKYTIKPGVKGFVDLEGSTDVK